MAQYATASELASYLQQDLDSASANQALTLATGEFTRRARKRWAATAETWTTDATFATRLALPFRDVTAVTAVKVNGVGVPVDYTLRDGVIYRDVGFGNPYAWPPDVVTVEFTYGLTTVPDDVKLAVLGCAAELYENPGGAVSESVDDYTIRYNGSPISPGHDWRETADYYRGLLIA